MLGTFWLAALSRGGAVLGGLISQVFKANVRCLGDVVKFSNRV